MKAIRLHSHGPASVLRYEDVAVPEPKEDQVLVQLKSIGVNFVDIYMRAGTHQTELPITIGVEGAGVAVKLGPRASNVRLGDRVAYTNVLGSYAEYALVPSGRLIILPTYIDERTASAILLQGMTAHYLAHDAFPLAKGHSVLIHAGAGGVGLLLTQIAKQLGAHVIITASTEEKGKIALEAGADEWINYSTEDFEEKVRQMTSGRGVDVVYDSVGKSTFNKSLKCLARRGHFVSFGQASGPTPEIALTPLLGSISLTTCRLVDYTASREEYESHAKSVFDLVKSGNLKPRIFRTLPLSDAAEAHSLIESRSTIGKLLLQP
ncbi:MAG: quinone oxidoreductase family protein [Rhabdochlamydiaceae bacterium]